MQASDLLQCTSMPGWQDISLSLYKEFAETYLLPTVFKYYLENGNILDVRFTEWGIYHLLGIQHIDGKISKVNFFEIINNGLDFQRFTQNPRLRKRFNDLKHRIRMFGCIYQIMKNQNLFYVPNRQIVDTSIKADYIKYALIDKKGVNLGIRYIDRIFVAFTLLVDRSSNPIKTITGLNPVHVTHMEIIRNESIVEMVRYC